MKRPAHYGGQHGRHDKRAATNGNSRRQHSAGAPEAPSAIVGSAIQIATCVGMATVLR